LYRIGDIKSQLEHQNMVMSDQSDQIALLLREVSQLKLKASSSEPSDREKDERIRQLELELEEARSWISTLELSIDDVLMMLL
jgi:coronin-1B/1C/6